MGALCPGKGAAEMGTGWPRGVGSVGGVGAAGPRLHLQVWLYPAVAGMAGPSAQRPQWGLTGPPSAPLQSGGVRFPETSEGEEEGEQADGDHRGLTPFHTPLPRALMGPLQHDWVACQLNAWLRAPASQLRTCRPLRSGATAFPRLPGPPPCSTQPSPAPVPRLAGAGQTEDP